MDALIVNLHDLMGDRKHTELFTLLPSVCLSSKFDLNATATSLQKALVMISQQIQQVFFEAK